MAGYESRVRDVINQASSTFATASVVQHGLSMFLDPSLTGPTRFFQKAGFPFPLLTPQMSAVLTVPAAAGTRVVHIAGARLFDWLRVGMTVAFEEQERAVIDGIIINADDLNDITLTLRADLLASHAAGTRVTLRAFQVVALDDSASGDGSISTPSISLLSPFILVPGDTLVVGPTTFTLARAEEVSSSELGRTYSVQVTALDGLPALVLSDILAVVAKPAYRSEILSLPHTTRTPLIGGPVALDWVSGPMVSDYYPRPESQVFIEEFNSAAQPLSSPYEIEKNDTLVRLPILREQMLFWNTAEGGPNWNGLFYELHAYASGRAHVWTPCRPPLDPAPVSSVVRTVQGFAPYAVLLLSRFIEGTVSVVDATTKALVPATDYTVDAAAGVLYFVAGRAGQSVLVTYQPRLEWQLFARPSEDDLELTIVVGREPKQVFPLGAAGSANVLVIKTETADGPDQLHVSARRLDDAAGPFVVELGDWQMRSGTTAALRYVLTTTADVDYDYASSGLQIKPLWPVLELLRARLDGDSVFARYLDNGRMLL